MKYLMIIITAVALMNCGDTIVNGSAEYHELEVDMVEYCFGKVDGYYYVGPTDGYNMVEVTKEISLEDGEFKNDRIFLSESLLYVYGKGFALSCPNENISIKIIWN